ncbi:two-component system response regulator [Paenibacillus polymyxa]|uniref:response regulator n=1 Tax=Paenibacillus TaxID=44249 RepID=UPI0008FCD4F4|nr:MULTISPECIES: response regulator [Paenibacillus]APB72887.1 two-component system response regulator [Paenibacillus polymyxa]
MKAILIDDERSALTYLERLLEADGRLTVMGKYTSAQAGLDHLAAERADIVFIDIGMPEMNGLEAAEWIQQLDSQIHIVFVTAYSEYAIEAFELQALDYLLKPVHARRLSKTLDRIAATLADPRSSSLGVTAEQSPKVRCFQKLEILEDGQKAVGAKPFKWRTLKSQELFSFLLHHEGEWVSKEQLLDALWPEYHLDKAVVHLHTSVYQIRKALKERMQDTKLEYNLDRYRLNRNGWITDAELFERGISEWAASGSGGTPRIESLLALYRGNYLEEHDYPWAYAKREKLRSMYLACASELAREELRSGRTRQSVQRLLSLQQREPYSDDICGLLLTAYAQLGDYTAAQKHYESFVRILEDELGIEPQQVTHQLYVQLKTQTLPA